MTYEEALKVIAFYNDNEEVGVGPSSNEEYEELREACDIVYGEFPF